MRQITTSTTNTMPPALQRIKLYSSKYKSERDSAKADNPERTRLDVLKDAIERRDARAGDDVSRTAAVPAAVGGGESEQEKGTGAL